MTEGRIHADLPRVLSLSEVAERLDMRKANVAKFLARHHVKPAFAKSYGYLWLEQDIDRVKAERESNTERMATDAKRRRSALRRQGQRVPEHPALVRVGPSQRELLAELLRRPVTPGTGAERSAMRRLVDRGYAEPAEGRAFQLTEEGREAAVLL